MPTDRQILKVSFTLRGNLEEIQMNSSNERQNSYLRAPILRHGPATSLTPLSRSFITHPPTFSHKSLLVTGATTSHLNREVDCSLASFLLIMLVT
jgi:hypothetical protein